MASVSDVIDSNGLLKEGTRIVKYVAPEDFEVTGRKFYQAGQPAKTMGCNSTN